METGGGGRFEVYSIPKAVRKSDVILLVVPDEVAPEVYAADIQGNLEEGDVINFASGYNITYDYIAPPGYVDVTLVAPRMIGEMVGELYLNGESAPALLAVAQDHSGEAKEVALALSKAIGATRSGVVEGTFAMETKTDLLTEQGLMPIFLNALMAKYEIEMEEGLPPEIILTEEYLSREMSYIFDLMAKRGVMGQMPLHSRTSQYGQLSRTEEILEGKSDLGYRGIRKFMRKQMDKIDSGDFAREWSTEQQNGRPRLKELYEKFSSSDFIKDEKRTMRRLGLKEGE